MEKLRGDLGNGDCVKALGRAELEAQKEKLTRDVSIPHWRAAEAKADGNVTFDRDAVLAAARAAARAVHQNSVRIIREHYQRRMRGCAVGSIASVPFCAFALQVQGGLKRLKTGATTKEERLQMYEVCPARQRRVRVPRIVRSAMSKNHELWRLRRITTAGGGERGEVIGHACLECFERFPSWQRYYPHAGILMLLMWTRCYEKWRIRAADSI